MEVMETIFGKVVILDGLRIDRPIVIQGERVEIRNCVIEVRDGPGIVVLNYEFGWLAPRKLPERTRLAGPGVEIAPGVYRLRESAGLPTSFGSVP